MRRIRLKVAYDGTEYCGWQIQPNGITVEEVLKKGISKAIGEAIHLIGASRTDSGVHSLGNVAVFDTLSGIPADKMKVVINRHLPEDVVILSSDEVEPSWHPRYQDGILKTYSYHIWNGQEVHPLKNRYCTHITFPLDLDKMRKGADYFLGTHDFSGFCNIRTNVEDTVRRIENIKIWQESEEIIIQVSGNGFLYNMVRIMAGTLIRVGRGFYPPEKVIELLEKKKRTNDAVTAPAKGLVLESISYKEE